jgi:hypothetical protein
MNKQRIFVLCLLLIASSQCMAEFGITASTDRSQYSLNSELPAFQLSAFNSGEPVNVDIHIALISPNGLIYELLDWNTELRPALPNFILPMGFNFPPTTISNLQDFPGGLYIGTWQAVAALANPGTLDLLHVSVSPFQIIEKSECDLTNASLNANTCNGKALWDASNCISCHADRLPFPDEITNDLGTIGGEMKDLVFSDQEVLDLRAYVRTLY